jgi:hypothetical protein
VIVWVKLEACFVTEIFCDVSNVPSGTESEDFRGIVARVSEALFVTTPSYNFVSIQVRTDTDPVPSSLCGTTIVVSRMVFVAFNGSV